jgi:hypothetical protein
VSRYGVAYSPWHTLCVTATWYCEPTGDEPCRDPEGHCNGHDREAPGRELELERELDHPQECQVPRCCCPPEGDVRHDWYEIDPECAAGRHDNCLNRGYRCGTETSLYEWYDVEDLPKVTGVYRVRAWGSGPDHNGEYDAGIECEPAVVGGAS